MTQRGKHTWDLVVNYHKCPKCGFVLESRKKYTYRLGVFEKELECGRCHHAFSVTKFHTPKFGPLWDQEWKLF